ncbi:HAD family hydrolase [Vulcanococcus sp.]|jgi:HAD superfamily hydrolase (TIGR01509 family)|uniref:HAD family hydrolase n=1 Tax=Vulcanococcus sp. TaxID=2856995 RepID=UPI0037D9B557
MVLPAACLFDLDGLLLDTEPLHAQAWQQAARHFGRELSAEELMALRGRRRHDCADTVRGWIAASGGPSLNSAELLAVRQPIAEALLVQAPPMAGAPELVEHCHRQGIPMALATSSSREAVALKAGPHPWLQRIGVRVHGDDPQLERGKPAPDVFLLAAGRLGVAAADCWAFEDSPAGVAAAQAAGCRVHVLPPPHLDDDALARSYPGEHTRIQNLHQVIRALEAAQ